MIDFTTVVYLIMAAAITFPMLGFTILALLSERK